MSDAVGYVHCQNHNKVQTKLSKSISEKHRRRNRRRLMKRKLKRIKLKSKTRFSNLTAEKLESSSQQVGKEVDSMPINNYDWEQYRSNILTWQYKHEIAYWKSKAEALNYENKVLHSVIQSMCKSKPDIHHLKHRHNQQCNSSESLSDNEEQTSLDESDSDDSEIHFSDDVLAFLQKSAEHRLERDKNRLAEEECMETENTHEVNIPRKVIDDKRNEEVRLLYGESSKKIDGIETMVQLNFDRFMDLNKPILWPNIPLKLN